MGPLSYPESRRGRRNHQFDLLRIVFALLVLLAHAPEMTDGNRSREIFARLSHANVTFGDFGVDGFFLLSGFLIVQSWQKKPELLNFMRKRVLRIVPGYLVAALLSTLVIGLLAPGVDHFFQHLDIHFVKSILVLSSPSSPPVLPGNAYPIVNGSLWTISYEFRCYLMVALFGILGIFRKPKLWAVATLILLASWAAPSLVGHIHWNKFLYPVLGDPAQVFRLTAIYFVGGCFFIYRRSIKFSRGLALAVVGVLIGVRVLDPSRIELALVFSGSYLMFYFGQTSVKWLQWMKNIPDISYGIYLYGWPVEALWIWFHRGSPWTTFLVSSLICFVLGWLSWHLVEYPMLKLKKTGGVLLQPS